MDFPSRLPYASALDARSERALDPPRRPSPDAVHDHHRGHRHRGPPRSHGGLEMRVRPFHQDHLLVRPADGNPSSGISTHSAPSGVTDLPRPRARPLRPSRRAERAERAERAARRAGHDLANATTYRLDATSAAALPRPVAAVPRRTSRPPRRRQVSRAIVHRHVGVVRVSDGGVVHAHDVRDRVSVRDAKRRAAHVHSIAVISAAVPSGTPTIALRRTKPAAPSRRSTPRTRPRSRPRPRDKTPRRARRRRRRRGRAVARPPSRADSAARGTAREHGSSSRRETQDDERRRSAYASTPMRPRARRGEAPSRAWRASRGSDPREPEQTRANLPRESDALTASEPPG